MDSPFWLSRDEVRLLDRTAIEEFGVPSIVLMENAGRGAAELLMRLNPERLPVTILCGPGNNGGDGFVMARHLVNHGWSVDVRLFARNNGLSGDAAINFEVIGNSGIQYTQCDPKYLTDPAIWSQFLRLSFEPAEFVVDALFGTGLSRPLDTPFDRLVGLVNESGKTVLAVDIPSGLDCDSGRPLGPTVKAAHTATFVAWKKGFLEPAAKPWIGEVHVIDIGAPKKLVDQFRALRSGG